MNDLVKRLTKKVPIEAARPEKTSKALKECIDRKYVHIMFKETGTEIGIRLDEEQCDFSKADFKGAKGNVHLEGALTLNYDRVRCIADIDLSNLNGQGYLKSIEDAEYDKIISKSDF